MSALSRAQEGEGHMQITDKVIAAALRWLASQGASV
jgi:hypothetical protein